MEFVDLSNIAKTVRTVCRYFEIPTSGLVIQYSNNSHWDSEPYKFLNPENIGKGVEILLLSSWKAELNAFPVYRPPS